MQFGKAIIALDFSPAEDAILARLPALAGLGVGTLVLAHVLRIGYATGGGFASEAEAEGWLEERAEPLRGSGLVVRTAVGSSGVPAEELLAIAAREAADLVVIGTRSHNTAHDVFLGSVAREVLRLTERPVLLLHLPRGASDTAAASGPALLDHVLLATDFSAHAAGAEVVAAGLAAAAGRTTVLHVGDPETKVRPPLRAVMATAALRAIAEPMEAAGARVETLAAEGEPAPTIARVAAETEASLIVVGKHGQGWLQSLVVGSTALAIGETAGRPVLMVPLAAVDG